jgi:hypothetical protein
MTCDHPNLKTFTFSNGEIMSKCPDCNYGSGHYEQRFPSGELMYSARGKKRIIFNDDPDDPEESEGIQHELPELHPPSFSALFDEQAEKLAEENLEQDTEEDGPQDFNSPLAEETGSCAL